MSKREHVDAFFDRGTLQLVYFSKSENEEVGDKTEGSFVLAVPRTMDSLRSRVDLISCILCIRRRCGPELH